MNILLTGKSSFLISSLLTTKIFENDNLFEYEYGTDYTNIDLIIHFGSPSCKKDFEDRPSMAISMIDYTVAITEQALANECPVIFASSECVYEQFDPKNTPTGQEVYNLFKLAGEEYIKSLRNNFPVLTLRLPRIYDLKRTSGLVGNLLNNEVPEADMEKEVTFITKTQFLEFFEYFYNLFLSTNKSMTAQCFENKKTCKLSEVLGVLDE